MDTFKETPVIGSYDTIYIGNTLAILMRAAAAADAGQKVLLVTGSTALLEDECNGIIAPEDAYFSKLPTDLFVSRFGLRLIHPDALKRYAEDFCADHSVQLLYNQRIIGEYWNTAAEQFSVSSAAPMTDDTERYLLLAGKQGLCAVRVRWHIYSEADLKQRNNAYHLHLTHGPCDHPTFGWTMSERNMNYNVRVIPGTSQNSHYVLEVQCDRAFFNNDFDYITECQRRCLTAFSDLKQKRAGFEAIWPGRFSTSAYISTAAPGIDAISAANTAPGIHTVFAANTAPGIHTVSAANTAPGIHTVSAINAIPVGGPRYPKNKAKPGAGAPLSKDGCAFNIFLDRRKYPVLHSPKWSIQPGTDYDVIVCGGGTSGAMAAIFAAQSGARTLLIEMNEELGGTQTVGGVHKYWFGNHFKDVFRVDREILEICGQLSLSPEPGLWSTSDQLPCALRSFMLRQLCSNAGVHTITNAITFGVLKDGDGSRIHGIFCADKSGTVYAYRGKMILDATGDGDVAALAGAAFSYGSKTPETSYWASLAQYTGPDSYKNNFSSNVIVSDPMDYTRFIIQNRQRGVRTYDHGSYVSPRESRHIQGRYTITLKDILSFQQYEDGLYTVFSNYDPKGLVTADMVLCGVLVPPLQAQVPLRCLLPVDTKQRPISGLMVIGKAISCTHNAFPGLRMQPDLMHQGAVAGRVSAFVCRENILPENIPPATLRRLVWEISHDPLTLPENNLTLTGAIQLLDNKPRTQWVDVSLTECVSEPSPVHYLMMAEQNVVLAALKDRYLKDGQETSHPAFLPRIAAGIMAWHGSPVSLPVLLADLYAALERCPGELPKRLGSMQCVNLLPDHGVQPEASATLYLISRTKSTDILPIFIEIFQRLLHMPLDFHDASKGHWHYIHAFAYAAEHTGFNDLIPMLKALAALPELCRTEDESFQTDILYERLLLLRFYLYKSLACCGDLYGYLGLTDALECPIQGIALGACNILTELVPERLASKTDAAAWKTYLTGPDFHPKQQLILDTQW